MTALCAVGLVWKKFPANIVGCMIVAVERQVEAFIFFDLRGEEGRNGYVEQL